MDIKNLLLIGIGAGCGYFYFSGPSESTIEATKLMLVNIACTTEAVKQTKELTEFANSMKNRTLNEIASNPMELVGGMQKNLVSFLHAVKPEVDKSGLSKRQLKKISAMDAMELHTILEETSNLAIQQCPSENLSKQDLMETFKGVFALADKM